MPGGKKAAQAPEAAKSKRLDVEPGGLVSGRSGMSRKGLQVDRRVGIALSVLPAKDRRLVERVIHSRRVFDGILAKSADIQELETSGRLLYRMAVSPSLQLIFSLSGDTVCMEDVVETATLRHFGDQKAPRPGRRRSVAARP